PDTGDDGGLPRAAFPDPLGRLDRPHLHGGRGARVPGGRGGGARGRRRLQPPRRVSIGRRRGARGRGGVAAGQGAHYPRRPAASLPGRAGRRTISKGSGSRAAHLTRRGCRENARRVQTPAEERAARHSGARVTAYRLRLAPAAAAAPIRGLHTQGMEDRAATLEIELRTPYERLEWLESRRPRHPVIVAEHEGGEITGWASLNAFNPREAYRFVADISVYVERSWRGKGAGRVLLERLVELGRPHGVPKAVLAPSPVTQARRGPRNRRALLPVSGRRSHGPRA